jgi:hypothetical protein
MSARGSQIVSSLASSKRVVSPLDILVSLFMSPRPQDSRILGLP